MTRAEVAKLVAVLLAAFPHAKTTPQTSEVYESLLADLDYAVANIAVRRLIASSRFMPSVAEIRAAVLEADEGAQRPGGEAWGDVIAAVHRFGVYRTPVFEDPTVARVVRALGWEEICNSENQAADRARFIQAYDAMAGTTRRELAMPPDVRRLPESRGAGELRALIAEAMRQLPEGES